MPGTGGGHSPYEVPSDPAARLLMPPSREDIRQLSVMLAREQDRDRVRRGPGRPAEEASALAKAVGCSWSTAKSWIEGESFPNRKSYQAKLEELIEEHFPSAEIRVSPQEAHLLRFCAKQLRESAGAAGAWAAAKLEHEIRNCNAPDIARLAVMLAKRRSKDDGRMGPAAALAEAVGCSWNAARAWIAGRSEPRREEYKANIEALRKEFAGRMSFTMSRTLASMLLVVCADLRILFGSTGEELAERMERMVLSVYPDMEGQLLRE